MEKEYYMDLEKLPLIKLKNRTLYNLTKQQRVEVAFTLKQKNNEIFIESSLDELNLSASITSTDLEEMLLHAVKEGQSLESLEDFSGKLDRLVHNHKTLGNILLEDGKSEVCSNGLGVVRAEDGKIMATFENIEYMLEGSRSKSMATIKHIIFLEPFNENHLNRNRRNLKIEFYDLETGRIHVLDRECPEYVYESDVMHRSQLDTRMYRINPRFEIFPTEHPLYRMIVSLNDQKLIIKDMDILLKDNEEDYTYFRETRRRILKQSVDEEKKKAIESAFDDIEF